MRISDWSSDVCSSDLSGSLRLRLIWPTLRALGLTLGLALTLAACGAPVDPAKVQAGEAVQLSAALEGGNIRLIDLRSGRSEESRGGKECVSTCRSRWSPYH